MGSNCLSCLQEELECENVPKFIKLEHFTDATYVVCQNDHEMRLISQGFFTRIENMIAARRQQISGPIREWIG